MKFIKRVNASSMKPHSVVTNSVAAEGYIPWKERIDLDAIEAETDDEGFDDLLMSVEEGGTSGSGVVSAHRVPTAPGNFQRQNTATKTAASSRWDNDFAEAQAHARKLIADLNR